MIQEFINKFLNNKSKLEAVFAEKHPNNYKEIVKIVVTMLTDGLEDYDDNALDPDRIHEIDDGDYQGTLVYIIGARGYQPSEYWYTKVDYGSCSGCDTLEAIRDYSDEKPNAEQVKDYITLALHLVERMKKM